MKIQKINKINGYRIFRNFYWPPTTLPEFSDYNLIYGWNRTGKTTLANVLRCLEKREQLPKGDTQLTVDGRIITDKQFGTDSALPMIRVFNKEFVDENIFNATDNVSPIYILGEDSINKQKEIQEETKELEAKKRVLAQKNSGFAVAESSLDTFCIDNGKLIKELLRSSGDNPYSNYNKASFKAKCDELAENDDLSKFLLSESEKELCKKQKESTPKDKVNLISFSFQDMAQLVIEAGGILNKTVTSHVINRLKQDPDIEQWVQEGLAKHKEKKSTICLFCEQNLPENYIQKLEGHFNDEFKALISNISELVEKIGGYIKETDSFVTPDKAALYDFLQSEYVKQIDELQNEIEIYISSLKVLKEKLKEKKLKLFEYSELDHIPVSPNASKIAALNEIIQKHNQETDNFDALVSESRKRLEESIVSESLADYKQKVKEIDALQEETIKLKNEIEAIEKHIKNLEREVIEHQQPAEELNKDIESYLGSNELKFEVRESGYQIYRDRELARNLSEGERTAIAFLYFLKTLRDRKFDLSNGIVVIDDPVSSLDSNALFCAFGFLKERTKGTGQLFILTHNFTFFRQIKNWLNHMNKNKRAFYMLECSYIEGHRTAALKPLDRLLYKYESEYQYLFSVVYEFSNKDDKDLEQYYHIPNIARRLLEAFLAFRQPSSKTLHKKLEDIDYDAAKKARIYRFVHTHSHSDYIEDGPDHDMSILSETPSVLKDVLGLIESEDKKHYDQMVNIVVHELADI
ncbi:MAG: hypothetical protein FJ240_11230 [Nitrospira sp.]|nr:hypothetical protein [Nitrospira sp.]